MSKINFKKLVDSLISEQLSGNTLREQLLNLLKTNQTYITAIPEESSEEQILDSLIDLAWRINYGTGYNSARNSEIARNRAFWPIIDFFTDILTAGLNNPREELKSGILDQPLETIVSKKNADINAITTAADRLATPEGYSPKNRRINDIKYNTANLAGDKYKNDTPLDGVLNAIRAVKGYSERQVNDIMKFPRKYDSPASIDLQELLPIRRISQALYLFYVNRLKSQLYTSILQTLVPEFTSLTKEKINDIIDQSVGQQAPQNRSLQQDYEQFLNGQSKLLVKLIAEGISKFDLYFSDLLQEDVPAASWKPSAQQQNNSQQNQQQAEPKPAQQQTPTQKTWKPTTDPVIKTITDFKQGIGNDPQVEEAYIDFYNTLTKGTKPSGWQTAGKIFSGILQGLDDIGSAMGKL